MLHPGAQLHRHRYAAAGDRTAHDRSRQLVVLEQGRAGAGLAHLAHRAAHVDVDQIGAGLGRDRRAGAHHFGIVPEQLDRDRVLVGVDPQQLPQGALVAIVQAEARDHLREGETGAVAARLESYEPVADSGQRRQQDPVGDLDAPDRERLGELRH